MQQKKDQRISVLFMFYGILFCVCLITANVLETKQISLGPANMTAGDGGSDCVSRELYHQ